MEKPNDKQEKYIGAIIGAAVGDALGWPNEQNSKNVSKETPMVRELFQKWSRSGGGRFWSHIEIINPGEYSDDTQLIIATARSLWYGSDWNRHFTKIELPAWLSYERGGGGATKRAAQAWSRGSMPWSLEKEKKSDVQRYFHAGGNGVAMRILPHTFKNGDDLNEAIQQVFLNGIYTHGHPRALVGAILYADALLYLENNKNTLDYGELADYLLDRKEIWGAFPSANNIDSWLNSAQLIMDETYMDVWVNTVDETMELLRIAKEGLDRGPLDIGNEILEKLGCFDKKYNGSGTITAVASIYLASKYASSPRQGIIEAAFLKNADTDTLASMVGGLLGMLHGSEFLYDHWLDIQDFEFLRKLIHKMPVSEELAEAPLFDYKNPDINFRLKRLNKGESLKICPFGEITLEEIKFNKSNAKGAVVKTLKFLTEDGQSIFSKTYEKEEKQAENQDSKEVVNKHDIKPLDKGQSQLHEIRPANGYKPVLNAKKIRGLVNILPRDLQFDICVQFVADVMTEMERSGTSEIGYAGLEFLKSSWRKYDITEEHILKIIDVIRYY